jgi:hypothetical protein
MNTPLLTVALLSAAAALSAQTASSPSMSYDSIRVTHDGPLSGGVESGKLSGFGVSGSVLLGEKILVGASWRDFNSENSLEGDIKSLSLGYRLGVGSGDIIIGASYGQAEGKGYSGSTNLIIDSNIVSLNLAYRHAFSSSLEGFVSYSRVRTELAAASYNLNTLSAVGASTTLSDNVFGLALRYNLTRALDVTVGYNWTGSDGALSVSAGYNF